MVHVLPVKIECRYCLGDGYMTHGYSKPLKLPCPMCQGAKHKWVDPAEVKGSDVVLKR